MELGRIIRQLRYKAGWTQEQLAERLTVSAQAVSKWENQAAMPDIALLPAIAAAFGVSIDELFDRTTEERLRRIESRMETEDELPGELFFEYEEYLKGQLGARDSAEDPDGEKNRRVLSLLADLYHHRMESDARKVSRYARESIRLAPGVKDCQWLLCRAEGANVWDWNCSNHARVIDFYKEVVAGDRSDPPTPLPYFYLLDNLLADRRAEEARGYLDAYRKLPGARPVLIRVYEAHIALAEFDVKTADALMEAGLEEFAGDPDFLFEAAQYYAGKCDYDRAVACYEASYEAEANKKPRFTDALEGIAAICEIRGDCRAAADAWDRILDNLKNEWGLADESVVREAEAEKSRLLGKSKG